MSVNQVFTNLTRINLVLTNLMSVIFENIICKLKVYKFNKCVN